MRLAEPLPVGGSRSAVHARAELRATMGAGGRQRLARMRSQPPLTLRPTPAGVMLVGTTAGPLGGDELELSVRADPATSIRIGSTAAQLVQPDADRATESVLRVRAHVDDGASLVWVPEPTVLVRDCRHRAETEVVLGAGARLVLKEVIVLGRHDEPAGSALLRTSVTTPAGPLLVNETRLGPLHPDAEGVAGTGGYRSLGTLVCVGTRPVDVPPEAGTRVGMHQLRGDDAWLVTVLGERPGATADLLDRMTPLRVGRGVQ